MRFICNPGYQLKGERTIVCQDDLEWSDDTPKCLGEFLCSCCNSFTMSKLLQRRIESVGVFLPSVG